MTFLHLLSSFLSFSFCVLLIYVEHFLLVVREVACSFRPKLTYWSNGSNITGFGHEGGEELKHVLTGLELLFHSSFLVWDLTIHLQHTMPGADTASS